MDRQGDSATAGTKPAPLKALIESLLFVADEPVRIDRLASVLEAPFVGTDNRANFAAYYARLRTIGVLPAESVASVTDAQLRTLNVRSILARSDLDLTHDLVAIPGYQVAGEASICGVSYTVVAVPR
jgi:hypothetical protein